MPRQSDTVKTGTSTYTTASGKKIRVEHRRPKTEQEKNINSPENLRKHMQDTQRRIIKERLKAKEENDKMKTELNQLKMENLINKYCGQDFVKAKFFSEHIDLELYKQDKSRAFSKVLDLWSEELDKGYEKYYPDEITLIRTGNLDCDWLYNEDSFESEHWKEHQREYKAYREKQEKEFYDELLGE